MLNILRLMTIALLFQAASSWAMPMDYTFEIVWIEGGYAGTSSTVYVTLDGLTGTGVETFTDPDSWPEDGLPEGYQGGAVLAFDVGCCAGFFDMAKCDEPECPTLLFENGLLQAVDYWTESQYPGFYMHDGTVYTGGIPDSVVFKESYGFVDFASWSAVPDGSAPAPATLALFGLGLAGLGISRGKRQTHG